MKLHRFIGPFDLSQEKISIKDKKILNQIKNVLRLKPGERIILSDGKGKVAETTILTISPKYVECAIENIMFGKEMIKKVSLYLSVLKKENFELAVQKATEAGVSEIIPIITKRTVKKGLNSMRIEKIIREASEQCGRNTVPLLSPVVDFKKALDKTKNTEEKIIFDLRHEMYQPDSQAQNASIFVGPEGGFTEEEIELAQKKGFRALSLGDLTLRAETAAIIATYRTASNV